MHDPWEDIGAGLAGMIVRSLAALPADRRDAAAMRLSELVRQPLDHVEHPDGSVSKGVGDAWRITRHADFTLSAALDGEVLWHGTLTDLQPKAVSN